MRLLRYPDLEQRNIVASRAQLKNLIDKYHFPAGFMLSANARAWRETDVNDWLDERARLIAGPTLRGAARGRRGRPRKVRAQAEETAAP